MKNTLAMVVLHLTATCAIFAQAQPSPAEISIRKAQEQIGKQPDHAAYYDSLAMAYARRGETS